MATVIVRPTVRVFCRSVNSAVRVSMLLGPTNCYKLQAEIDQPQLLEQCEVLFILAHNYCLVIFCPMFVPSQHNKCDNTF